jgi:Na+-transporting methylmalonyl-CoA/oxaloacetate decarboxylase gamma subunit
VLRAAWFVVAGMGIVFATLTVLVLVMSVLNRWLAPMPHAKTRTGGPAAPGGHATRARNA